MATLSQMMLAVNKDGKWYGQADRHSSLQFLKEEAMKPRETPTRRCIECGAKCTKLDDDGTCFECVLVTKIKREGRPEPAMDHPAIKKTKTY